MTVAAAAAKAGPYTGNDSASSFAFSFKVFADADIRVVKTVIASGAESDLVLNTDYTVTRNVDQDNNPGGSVVYKVGGVTTALPSTLKLTIVGDFDYAQPTDIPNGGSFFASVIETAFDRLTMLIKQLKERVDNALTLPVSVSGVSAELPTPEAAAIIGWNTAGDALVNYDAASLAGAVAAVDWLVDTFDGDAAETAFVLTRDPGVAANCDVSISGVTQVPGVDFTVSSTSLTFTTPPAAGTGNICVRYGSALPSAASVSVNGVATASIQDLAVTTDKIAADAVTTAKIADVELKALAGLASAANKVPMFSGSGAATLLDFKDEDDMASDSATAVPSQQSVKAYVAAEVAAIATGEITLGTPQATTSGVAIDFTGIPAGTKRITVNFSGVSTNGLSPVLVQIGDAGGVEVSGYACSGQASANVASTAGWICDRTTAAAALRYGSVTLSLESSSANTWCGAGCVYNNTAPEVLAMAGTKSLSAELTQVRITTVNGTDTFDAGGINISYE